MPPSAPPGAASRSAPPPASTPDDSPLAYGPALRDRILGAFRGSMRPVKVTPVYQLGLALVAFAMVLLPIVYLALVAATAWATVQHAIHDITVFQTVRNAKAALLLYAGPLVVGAIAIFFLVKPLFAPRPARGVTRSLDAREEPILFAFVERLCREVGAPMPSRIDVDCQVNASASFRRGLLSLVGNDLVLTIGLPLARGLSLEQLAGVLAHEFGHFAQGAGMRLSYVVRSINGWFARVVYERDAWDLQLENASRTAGEHHLFFALVLQLARGMVWLVRRILWALMHVGHAISCFLLRQMEYDADRYEARLVGSENFAATARDLAHLGVAHQKSLHDLSATWRDGRLAADLPGLVVTNRERLPGEVVRQVEAARQNARTGRFDTHPADIDRVASARRETDPPIFRIDLPATVLFRDFSKLSAEVSHSFYELSLGQEIDESALVENEHVLETTDRGSADREAFDRFVAAPLDADRALPLSSPSAEAPDPGRLAERVEAARERVRAGSEAYARRLGELEEVVGPLVKLDLVKDALDAGATIEPKPFGLEKADTESIERRRQLLGRRLELLDRGLGEHEEALVERFDAALRVFDLPGLGAHDPEIAELAAERDRLVSVARAVAARREDFPALRRTISRFVFVASNLTEDLDAPGDTLIALTVSLREQLDALVDAWTLPYPFEHPTPDLALGAWVVPAPVETLDGQALFDLAQESLARVYEVYGRVLARLATLAERGEKEIGFEPS